MEPHPHQDMPIVLFLPALKLLFLVEKEKRTRCLEICMHWTQ